MKPQATHADPDLALAGRFLAANPPPGRVLLCAVTGSHIYGFPSPDSDIDLKGVHLAPTPTVLGLDPVRDAHDRLEIFEGTECDLTTHEVGRALRLLLAGNGNMLERIFSPIQLARTPELAALRALAVGALSRRFAKHYLGFMTGICREHEKAAAPSAKALLYIYRVALTGQHLMQTGEVVADVTALATEKGFPEVHDLVAFKQGSAEKAIVDAADDARHRANWPRLRAALASAREDSPLPEAPANADACSDWLVGLRLAEVNADV